MISVVEINAESAVITVSKGFLLVRVDNVEEKIALDNIESLIINSHAALISNHAIMRLSELGIPVTHCGNNAIPCALTLPYGQNVYRKERIDLQLSASAPLEKNLWKQVIKAKIGNQAAVLALCGKRSNDLETLCGKVASGDIGNLEAVAARIYWERLFGKGFRRNPDQEGINSFLNYGYAILRASFCRNLVASGLLPELGIHHVNQKNPYCLADDLMEPFRPFMDLLIVSLGVTNDDPLTTKGKKSLISILDLEQNFMDQKTHLRFLVPRIINIYITSLAEKKPGLVYPEITAATQCSIHEMIRDRQ